MMDTSRFSSRQDTIAAIATASGRAALAIVRLSGADSVRIIQHSIGGAKLEPRSPQLRRFNDEEGHVIDQVVVTWFAGPKSYTGEDLVEICCHGGRILSHIILDACLNRGARLAEPGEFTLRAFLNGRMDLTQAEAVQDLIESQTRHQVRMAARQLDGELSAELQPEKDELVQIISHLETTVEFVEDDVSPEDREQLAGKLQAMGDRLCRMLATARAGRLLREGAEVVISGRPNTGKSSLFNCLLRMNRALVSAEPGTTRDALRESISLDGIPVTLVDSAGVRESPDQIEAMGVERSVQSVRQADLILFVLDSSLTLSEEDERIRGVIAATPFLVVKNKIDLEAKLRVPDQWKEESEASIRVSAKTGQGLSSLEEGILKALGGERVYEQDDILLTSLRHRGHLEKAVGHLQEGAATLKRGESEEFALYDLRKALDCLGRVTGEVSVDDLLDNIFSSFCIGK